MGRSPLPLSGLTSRSLICKMGIRATHGVGVGLNKATSSSLCTGTALSPALTQGCQKCRHGKLNLPHLLPLHPSPTPRTPDAPAPPTGLNSCMSSLSLSPTPPGPPANSRKASWPLPLPPGSPRLPAAHCPSCRPGQALLASSNLSLAPQHVQEQIQAPWDGGLFKALSQPVQPHSPIPA